MMFLMTKSDGIIVLDEEKDKQDNHTQLIST